MSHAILFIRCRVVVLHFMKDIIVKKVFFLFLSLTLCSSAIANVNFLRTFVCQAENTTPITLRERVLLVLYQVLLVRKAQTHFHGLTSARIYIRYDLAQKQQLYETHDL